MTYHKCPRGTAARLRGGEKRSMFRRVALALVVSSVLVGVLGQGVSADHGGPTNVTVTPNSNLADDVDVAVSVDGVGLYPDVGVQVQQCRSDATSGSFCQAKANLTTSSS